MCSDPRFTRCAERISRIRRGHTANLFLPAVCAAFLFGCDALSPRDGDGGLSPVLVRLKNAYPDLAGGRFVVLADFESAEQAGLLRCVDASGAEIVDNLPAIDIAVARNETGAGSVRCVFPTGAETILLDGQRSEQITLIRDWRGYALFLVSARASADAVLEMTICDGRGADRGWRSRLRVGPRWSLHRIDLAEVADVVDLADVRSVSFRPAVATAALTLNLDDLVLTDNAREIFATNAPGGLYVRAAGRRVHVGASDRFDLAFTDGVISAWTSGSPENLTVRSGLGPWPVALSENWRTQREALPAYDDAEMFAHWGESVAATQRIVETDPFRIQIAGEWRFVRSAGGENPAGDASIRWLYTIHSDGRVYVGLRCDPGEAGWRTPLVGQAIALRGDREFERVQTAGSPQKPALPFALLSRAGADRGDLLWVTSAADDAAHALFLSASDQSRDVLLTGQRPAVGVVEFADMLLVWPPDLDAAVDAQAPALGYQTPLRLSIKAGSLVTDAPGDLNRDGFNETEGVYELAAIDGVLRFHLLLPAATTERPRFRVRHTAGMKAWVYVGGRIVRETGRDIDDNLLFQIPPLGGVPVEIEVNARPERSAPTPTRPQAATQPS